MRNLLTAFVLSALLIVATAAAVAAQRGEPSEPVLPAEVMVELDYAGWQSGVYVQPIATRADGQIGCRFIVAVGAESVGAELEATIDGNPVSATVAPYWFNGVVNHGRATFVIEGAGEHTFATVNTTPIVGATC